MKLNLSGKKVNTKTAEEIKNMRLGGLIWQAIRDHLRDQVKIGMELTRVEEIAKEQLKRYGVKESFNQYHEFPSVVCLSLNECVVHGPANKGVFISGGDKLTIDLGFTFQGLNIDGAFNLYFDPIQEEGGDPEEFEKKERKIAEYRYLHQLTMALFYESIRELKEDELSGSITERMETFFNKYFPKKYKFLDKFTGHGIGYELHEHPRIHNFGLTKDEGEVLPLHSTICIEPMIIEQENGSWVLGDDEFGVYIKNKGGLTIHYEHTILIREKDVEVLTASIWELQEMKEAWELVKKT
ncbi:methionine aminopeptidase [Mycoplasma wenyonii str. Massachusetts]|uniref:Methionine aminopeptidase n=1 Tax=Mycoplasma wenyonii (strain Massachusetts) TaxID=1197325 RepID=I6YB05_MYCWM|nr:methionyl aminopeptidase [Mycoplasma wenyonii]AFN65151.1 methionine aminopeptidase [Mycoplasma wenyonii str. Massachusetts]